MKSLEGTKYNVLIIKNSFSDEKSPVAKRVNLLKDDLTERGVNIIQVRNFQEALEEISINKGIDCLLVDWNLKQTSLEKENELVNLIATLHERQEGVPVFLLAEKTDTTPTLNSDVLNSINEYLWILQDDIDFIGERISEEIKLYRDSLLPPLAKAVFNYNKTAEYSWAVPGHQGGVGFLKTAIGKKFFDFYGENLFRTDLGIERTAIGSLLDHTGAFYESEKNIARIFGADMSFNVLVGTSGSNRTVIQGCLTDKDTALIDRNCHKSIEQGLIITGAKPVYMTPTRNRYGIIGPILPETMKEMAKVNPKYAVVTNCTYDGVLYNTEKIEEILSSSVDYLHLDEAWYGYARFYEIYKDHFAMRGKPEDHRKDGATIFATQSTHKLLNALSQASFIHVRNGKKTIDLDRFNQSYMMHATTSPLYALAVSNDIGAAMMEGNAGKSLVKEVIKEAVEFRQEIGKLYKEYTAKGDWFFKPWNAEKVTDPKTKKIYDFEKAPKELLIEEQDCWVMHPEDKWHGFKNLPENWAMLDPIKVSILAPGMEDNGELAENGVPAALVSAYLEKFGIIPTRTTDFQVMFIFAMGITEGKWTTLVNMLLSFKKHYDNNTPIKDIFPDLVLSYPQEYENIGLHDLGDKMFKYLRENNPGAVLNEAYSILPKVDMLPREAYNNIVDNNVELVPATKLEGRIAANSVIPYPPGIPMLMSGENFGDKNSPFIKYLNSLSLWDKSFPGFEHEIEGTHVIDGIYNVLCIKNR